jgi:hypothetical protein
VNVNRKCVADRLNVRHHIVTLVKMKKAVVSE